MNKPCVREARFMRLISWTLQSGSEQLRYMLLINHSSHGLFFLHVMSPPQVALNLTVQVAYNLKWNSRKPIFGKSRYFCQMLSLSLASFHGRPLQIASAHISFDTISWPCFQLCCRAMGKNRENSGHTVVPLPALMKRLDYYSNLKSNELERRSRKWK